MKTKFPYSGKIDYQKYWDAYMQREDAIKTLPTEAELKELARKGIVKEHLVLLPVPADEAAQLGDTVTMATVSDLPKFNKPRVTASLGRGLYNKELEETAVGKKVGDRFELTVQDKKVAVTVLEIKRKSAPEPTDEMVAAMGVKDNFNKPITTVEAYESFIIEEDLLSKLATINYEIMTQILSDYPVNDCDESDIARLGELERDMFIRLFKEQEGKDLLAMSKEEMQEMWHCDSLDDFIAMRRDWYKMKIQQCLVYQNILGLPDEGKTDPLDHYEVLSELQDQAFNMIKEKLGGC